MSKNWILGVLVAATAFGCATAQKPAADSRTASNSLGKSASLADQHCARDTGSHIKRPDDKPCLNQPGRAYSQAQLESTGRIDIADALRQLDPSVQ